MRSLQPTGYAYLARQDTYSLKGAYARSERLDFTLDVTRQVSRTPLPPQGPALPSVNSDAHYLFGQLSMNWHWTDQWVLSLRALRVQNSYGPPTVNAASTGISVDLVRQFLRMDL